MTKGQDSKRARRRQRGRRKAEHQLQSARHACRGFPVFVPGLTQNIAHPNGATADTTAQTGATTAHYSSDGSPCRVGPGDVGRGAQARRPPVAGRVRLALAPSSNAAIARRPIAPRAPSPPFPWLAEAARDVVDIAAITRQRQVRQDGERHRSMAAMLVAALGLGSVVALDPFAQAPKPGQDQPRIAVLTPAEQTPVPLRPNVTPSQPPGPPATGPKTGRPETTPEERIAAVTLPPPVAVSPPTIALRIETMPADPPDGFLHDVPRTSRPRLAALPLAPVQEEAATALPPSTAAKPSPPTTVAFAPAAPAEDAVLPPVTARESERIRLPTMPGIAAPALPSRPPGSLRPDPLDDATPGLGFDQRLVLAAHELTRIPGGYDPKYMKIAYPMGDVPDGMGVCSDVIVRAYRGLGIDLQELIHHSKLGTGDTNVDHRRVTVLIRFFQKYGESLPVSPFPESYKPGDIVAYDVPWGRTSKWHIAVVTSQLSASLRPMVVHNRGYGAKLEDALFHKRIIGHFRFHDGNLKAMHSRPVPAPATADGKSQRRLSARGTAPRS